MPAKYVIRVRSYPEKKFQSVWIVRVDGAARSGMMWGELLPQAVEELIEATKLPVEIDDMPRAGFEPMTPPECVSTHHQQKELFQ